MLSVPGKAAPPEPKANWNPCYRDFGFPYECTTVQVPLDSRYAGPFTNSTANPVLVVGNFFDPATRYEGAVTVSNLLPNSRLLSLNGWGHASLFLSQCVDQAVSAYLTTGALPAEGTVCNQDLVPFIDFAALEGAAEFAAARRSLVTPALLPDVVKNIKK